MLSQLDYSDGRVYPLAIFRKCFSHLVSLASNLLLVVRYNYRQGRTQNARLTSKQLEVLSGYRGQLMIHHCAWKASGLL